MQRYRHLIGWVFLLIVAFLAAGLMMPSRWQAEARVAIAAEPPAVFPYVAELQRWQDWAVWFEHDPHMKVTWSEPAEGVGAGYAWTGNASVGNGELRIVDLAPDQRLDLVLSMDQGRFQSDGRIALIAESGGTEVVWTQEGSLGFDLFARLQRPLLEKSVAATLQASLEGLRRVVEAPP